MTTQDPCPARRLGSGCEVNVLSILTVNVQAASPRRAAALLDWLDRRPEQVFILTETSSGEGTALLLDRFRAAGWLVLHTPDPGGDRGCAVVGRAALTPWPEVAAGVSLPGRVVTAVLDTEPTVGLLGLYVPSSDRAADKVDKKRRFIASVLAAIDGLSERDRGSLVIGGDYNVIARDHQPAYRGFLPFEYALLDQLAAHGFVDAHQHCTPGVQAHSWIGRGGNGYRFDYLHIGASLTSRITSCAYVHEPREQRLSDHAAVTVALNLDHVNETNVDPAGSAYAGILFQR